MRKPGQNTNFRIKPRILRYITVENYIAKDRLFQVACICNLKTPGIFSSEMFGNHVTALSHLIAKCPKSREEVQEVAHLLQ